MSKNSSYGDFGLPVFGVIDNRNLKFVNANINQPNKPYVCLKNIINPRQEKIFKNKFGDIWYPTMFIDQNYNPNTGGYVNSNGPNGPYFALGLGNYPRSMYKEVYFGNIKSLKPSQYCLPKEKKYPVNNEKRCSSALTYARYAEDPCKIANCVQRKCKQYPNVGKSSELVKECKSRKTEKKKKNSKK